MTDALAEPTTVAPIDIAIYQPAAGGLLYAPTDPASVRDFLAQWLAGRTG